MNDKRKDLDLEDINLEHNEPGADDQVAQQSKPAMDHRVSEKGNPGIFDHKMFMDTVSETVKASMAPAMEINKRDLQFRKWKFILISAFVVGVMLMQKNAQILESLTSFGDGYVNVVEVNGAIQPGKSASPENIIPLLEKAFKDNSAKGVVVYINSPGGTPVAAGAIRSRIIELREEYPDKEVLAVGGDYMTSGAYLVATGTDHIYANDSSLVGSIGVIIRTFGATELADKLGIERRVLHAGANKVGMDTFLPLSDHQRDHLQKGIETVHKQFIAKVQESRKGKITGDPDKLFSGEYWTGEEALSYGLIDGLGHLHSITNKHFETTKLKRFRPIKSFAESINPLASITAGIGDQMDQASVPYPLLMPH
jgi:protease-4